MVMNRILMKLVHSNCYKPWRELMLFWRHPDQFLDSGLWIVLFDFLLAGLLEKLRTDFDEILCIV